jgi:chemotaxis protein MotB
MRSSATLITAVLFALPMLAGGCVDQGQYDQMLMANRSLKEQMVTLEQDRDEAKANLDTVRQSLSKVSSELNGLKIKYSIADADLSKISGDYDGLMKRIGSLDFGPLPEGLSRDLEQLASQNSSVLTFDSKKGMLRFASDFTFASGSADLTSSASSSLSSLAKILNSPTASNFEVRIVGHTDNVPVSRPETKRNHPTNWHLSVHRSISVANALTSDGITPTRLQVAGCGEYRPVVPNPSKGGAEQNRRVEIFLVPMRETTMTANVPTNSSSTGGGMDEPLK